MSSYNEFIMTPMTDIIADVVNSSAGIGDGIETFPLCDYVMQSVFLKMTGFQEQKMKSIVWALASNDYEYRYEFSKRSLGECSTHDDKQEIYRDLVSQILKRSHNFKVANEIDRPKILQDTTSEVETGFGQTNLAIWAQRSFSEYGDLWKQVQPSHFTPDANTLLFKDNKNNNAFSLKTIYENNLYRHRNRIAHNTQSYQQNLPTLRTLLDDGYKYENYFFHFSILILIDNIFMELFKKYSTVLQDHVD